MCLSPYGRGGQSQADRERILAAFARNLKLVLVLSRTFDDEEEDGDDEYEKQSQPDKESTVSAERLRRSDCSQFEGLFQLHCAEESVIAFSLTLCWRSSLPRFPLGDERKLS